MWIGSDPDHYDKEVKNETTRELSKLILLLQQKKKKEVTHSCFNGACFGVLIAAIYFFIFVTNDNLLIAVQKGIVKDVEKLLLDGHDPNQKDGKGNPVLHYVCKRDIPIISDFLMYKFDILELLVEYDVDIEAANKKGDRVGHVCAEVSDFEMLKKLLGSGLTLGSLNSQGKNIINILVEKNLHDITDHFVQQMRSLFELAQPSGNELNNLDMLVLLYKQPTASTTPVLQLADLLLEYGANPNVVIYQSAGLKLYLLFDILEGYCSMRSSTSRSWLMLVVYEHGTEARKKNSKRIPLNIQRNLLITVCEVGILKQFVDLGATLQHWEYELSLMDEHIESFYRLNQQFSLLEDNKVEDQSKISRLEEEAHILQYLLSNGIFLTGSTMVIQGSPDIRATVYMKWGSIITEVLVKYAMDNFYIPRFIVLSYGEAVETIANIEKTERILILHTMFPPIQKGEINIHITCHGSFSYYWGRTLPAESPLVVKTYDQMIQTKVEDIVTSPHYLILFGNNRRCEIKTTIN